MHELCYLEWFDDKEGQHEWQQQGQKPLQGFACAEIEAVQDDHDHGEGCQQETQRVGDVDAPRREWALASRLIELDVPWFHCHLTEVARWKKTDIWLMELILVYNKTL